MTKKIYKGRVILTYARSIMSLVAANSLAKKGIEVYAVDDLDMTILKFSKYVSKYIEMKVCDNDEDYIKELEKIIIENKPEDDTQYVLMPIHKHTYAIAKHKQRLEKHIKVATPNFKSIEKIHPKDHFSRTTQKLGIRSPLTLQFKTEKDINFNEINYPVLVKPVEATGGRGITKVKNQEELTEEYRKIKSKYNTAPIIQELVSGDDYCFAGIFERGELKAHMAYTNLYKFPAESGAGCMRETVDDSVFLEDVKKIAKELEWHGVAEFDFMWDGKSTSNLNMIEINPRFWGGLFQSVESGIDFPWLLYQLTVTGKIYEKQEAQVGTKTKLPFLWISSALKDFSENDNILEKMGASFKKAFESGKNKGLFEKLKNFGEAFSDSFHSKSIDLFKENFLSPKSNIKSELFMEEDPLASLGVLYIVSSIIKKGKLPPEIKF